MKSHTTYKKMRAVDVSTHDMLPFERVVSLVGSYELDILHFISARDKAVERRACACTEVYSRE